MTKKIDGESPKTEVWLKQPNNVVTMRHPFDTMQGKIIAAIIEKLQDKIEDCIGKPFVPTEDELFRNEEFEEFSNKSLMLTISYKDIGVSPKNYRDLRESLRKMADIPVDINIRDKDGHSWVVLDHFCTPIIETDQDEYGQKVERKYSHTFKIMISQRVLNFLLDSSGGFHKFLRQVVMTTKNKYAFRFYLLISAWKNRGCTPEYTVQYIREWLKMEDKCQRWNMFVSRVINPAHDELVKLCKQGMCDVYFEPELIYKDGKKRGEPAAMKFHIFGKNELLEAGEEESPEERMKKFLTESLEIKEKDVNEIIPLVTEANRTAFSEFCKKLLVASKNGNVVRRSSYNYKSVMSFLRDWKPQSVASVPQEGMLDRHAARVAARTYVCDESASEWQRVLSLCRERWSAEEVAAWVEPLKYLGRKDGKVYVKMPTSIFGKEMYTKGYYAKFLDLCREVCPDEDFCLQ